MIVYKLACSGSHVFEAWFRDSAGYEAQAAAGEISCPVCGGVDIAKAPMAPNIASGRGERERGGEGGGAPRPRMSAADRKRGEIVGRLRALRAEIEKTSEHVGDRFPEEARKIHYGEAEPRGIHGDADRKEAEALRDEGIDVKVVPWVPPADS